MKHNRFPELVVALLFVCAPGLLAEPKSPVDADAAAKSLVRLLEEHYRRPKTLRAVFLERYSEGPKQARIESGTVYFKRPGRMRWEYESPEKKLFLADGKSVWFYVPYDHTVTKGPAKESSDWRTPLSLLTGKVELSRLCSRVELIAQSGVPPGHAVLRCLPKGAKTEIPAAKNRPPDAAQGADETQDFTDVLLEIDAGSGELARIEIRQPGEIQLEYRFGDWLTDIPLSDDLFHFQVPAGVAIVDAASMAASPR